MSGSPREWDVVPGRHLHVLKIYEFPEGNDTRLVRLRTRRSVGNDEPRTDDEVVFLGDLAGDDDGNQGGHESQREDEGGHERDDDCQRHRLEHLALHPGEGQERDVDQDDDGLPVEGDGQLQTRRPDRAHHLRNRFGGEIGTARVLAFRRVGQEEIGLGLLPRGFEDGEDFLPRGPRIGRRFEHD